MSTLDPAKFPSPIESLTGPVNGTIAEHGRRAAEWYALRLTSPGACPRRLVGRRHIAETCWCASRLNDHGRRYRTQRDDTPVILWEPYDANPVELGKVFAAAAADGLEVSITGASPWFPGRTFAIAFSAAEPSVTDRYAAALG